MIPKRSRPAVSRVLIGVVLAAASAVVGGCGPAKPTGQVVGQVVYRGQPVTQAEVNLYAKGRGSAASAKLDGSGRFTLGAPLEAGTYAVYLTPPPPTPVDPKLKAKAKKGPAALTFPAKYRDMNTSHLSVDIKEGDNDLKLELKD